MSILKHFPKLSILRLKQPALSHLQKALASTNAVILEYEKNPEPLFRDPETQRLLQSMTHMELSKVFRKATVPNNSTECKFLTTEQLEVEFRNTIEKAKKRLQMPPVVQAKDDEQRIIAKDPGLKDFSTADYVITDITYGLKQSQRKIVVRRTDGTLEYAPLEVTKRMKQLYFPLKGREIHLPRMFEEANLSRCLDEQKYEFILDRSAVQFEPFDREYHSICSRVYQHLNESKQFDVLRSTRHFGPMAFFYAWHRCIDDLLCDMIQRDLLSNAVELIALQYKIHNMQVDYKSTLKQVEAAQAGRELALEQLRKTIKSSTDDIHEQIKSAIGKSHDDFVLDEVCIKFIDQFIKEHALKKVQLELAMQTLKEINAEKKQLFEGLTKAHGIQTKASN